MANGTPGRTYVQWEERFLAEWCAARHPAARCITRVRLGSISELRPDPTLTEGERRLIGFAYRRWADAVIVYPDRVLLVEAGMVAKPGDVSQLETYMLLFPLTPEISDLHARPRRGVLVWAVDDPYCRQVAVTRGFEVDIFKPSNFTTWLEVVRGRERRASDVRASPPVASS